MVSDGDPHPYQNDRGLSDTNSSADSGPWRVLSASVRGATHKLLNRDMQDAITIIPPSSELPGPPIVAVVSDGHGDPRHWRSQIGAELAVTRLSRELQTFVDSHPRDTTSLRAVRQAAMDRLPRRLVSEWTKAVDQHLAANPFTEEDKTRLEVARGRHAVEALEANPAMAYGATFVAAVLTDSYLLCAQLGDGDILVAFRDQTIERPLPETAKGSDDTWSETESLAQPEAWQFVHVSVLGTDLNPICLLLLSTDGYRKGFADEASFRQVLPDFVRTVRLGGLDAMQMSLPDIVDGTARRGGGDDATIAIACLLPRISDAAWAPLNELSPATPPASAPYAAPASDSADNADATDKLQEAHAVVDTSIARVDVPRNTSDHIDDSVDAS